MYSIHYQIEKVGKKIMNSKMSKFVPFDNTNRMFYSINVSLKRINIKINVSKYTYILIDSKLSHDDSNLFESLFGEYHEMVRKLIISNPEYSLNVEDTLIKSHLNEEDQCRLESYKITSNPISGSTFNITNLYSSITSMLDFQDELQVAKINSDANRNFIISIPALDPFPLISKACRNIFSKIDYESALKTCYRYIYENVKINNTSSFLRLVKRSYSHPRLHLEIIKTLKEYNIVFESISYHDVNIQYFRSLLDGTVKETILRLVEEYDYYDFDSGAAYRTIRGSEREEISCIRDQDELQILNLVVFGLSDYRMIDVVVFLYEQKLITLEFYMGVITDENDEDQTEDNCNDFTGKRREHLSLITYLFENNINPTIKQISLAREEIKIRLLSIFYPDVSYEFAVTFSIRDFFNIPPEYDIEYFSQLYFYQVVKSKNKELIDNIVRLFQYLMLRSRDTISNIIHTVFTCPDYELLIYFLKSFSIDFDMIFDYVRNKSKYNNSDIGVGIKAKTFSDIFLYYNHINPQEFDFDKIMITCKFPCCHQYSNDAREGIQDIVRRYNSSGISHFLLKKLYLNPLLHDEFTNHFKKALPNNKVRVLNFYAIDQELVSIFSIKHYHDQIKYFIFTYGRIDLFFLVKYAFEKNKPIRDPRIPSVYEKSSLLNNGANFFLKPINFEMIVNLIVSNLLDEVDLIRLMNYIVPENLLQYINIMKLYHFEPKLNSLKYIYNNNVRRFLRIEFYSDEASDPLISILQNYGLDRETLSGVLDLSQFPEELIDDILHHYCDLKFFERDFNQYSHYLNIIDYIRMINNNLDIYWERISNAFHINNNLLKKIYQTLPHFIFRDQERKEIELFIMSWRCRCDDV